MATKRSNTLTKSQPFKIQWWMVMILVIIIAAVGILVIRLSHASSISQTYSLPLSGSDPKLSTYTNQDIDDPTPNPKPGCPATGETIPVLKTNVQKGCLINAGQEVILESNNLQGVSNTGRTVCVNLKTTSTKPTALFSTVTNNSQVSPTFSLSRSQNQSSAPAGTEQYCGNMNTATNPAQNSLLTPFSINGFNKINIGIPPALVGKNATIYSITISAN